MNKPVKFQRRNFVLRAGPLKNTPQSSAPHRAEQLRIEQASPSKARKRSVLVINSSRKVASAIKEELESSIPHSKIYFAPTFTSAASLLRRRPIDLIVSSSVLPDGSVDSLDDVLLELSEVPSVIVIRESFGEGGHTIGEKLLGTLRLLDEEAASQELLSELGADLRNDLNNPLQEIVAMVFVAKAGNSGMMDSALGAIQNAADNMARVVSDIEERIRSAVGD